MNKKEEAQIVFNILMKFRFSKQYISDFLEQDKKDLWKKIIRRESSYLIKDKYKEKKSEYRKKWYEKNKEEYLKKLKERRDILKNVDKKKSNKLKKIIAKRFNYDL